MPVVSGSSFAGALTASDFDGDGAKAFEAERFGDARTQLGPIVKEAPELPEGRELMGLTLYRLGKWKDAIEHLEAFREISEKTLENLENNTHRKLTKFK